MSVCDVPVVTGLCHVAAGAQVGWLGSALDGAADVMGGLAAVLFTSMWGVFEATTFVDVTNGRFTRVYNLLFGIAVFVMMIFFLLQVISGMIRREPAALTRAALGLAKSILGSFVVLTLVAAALAITDQITVAIVAATGTTLEQLGGRIVTLGSTLAVGVAVAPGAGALLALFVTSLAVGAAFIIWISLLVRKALLLIAIVFAPVAMAGLSWDATRGWVSKWTTLVIALILSKLVIVVFFLLATSQATAPITADLQSIADPITGVMLLLIAGFAPYLTYKAISFIGVDYYHAMSSEQEAKHALNRPLPLPTNHSRPSPPSVLSARGDSATPPASTSTTTSTPGPRGNTGTAGTAGTSSSPRATVGVNGGNAAGGASAGAASAASGIGAAVTAGAVAAKSAWDGGQRVGRNAAGTADQHHDSADRARNGGDR